VGAILPLVCWRSRVLQRIAPWPAEATWSSSGKA